GVQCITIRTTTERPVTVEMGTNQLVGDDYVKTEQVALEVLNGKKKQGKIPEKWDGKTAERLTEIILLKLL
ncbi:MAG: UDP-N-acetylglucosamine 2-epimerase, partial [Ignavibacteriaceae bacterium]